jgi:hypothetical protein
MICNNVMIVLLEKDTLYFFMLFVVLIHRKGIYYNCQGTLRGVPLYMMLLKLVLSSYSGERKWYQPFRVMILYHFRIT